MLDREVFAVPRRTLLVAALVVPAVTLGLWEYVRHQLLDPVLPTGWGNLASALVVALSVFGFVKAFSGLLTAQMHETAAMREQAAVLQERQRIAHDMHDRVAQALYFLEVKFDHVSQLMEKADWQQAETELRALRRHLRAAAAEVASVVKDLKQAEADAPLPQQLRQLAHRLPKLSKADIQVALEGEFAVAPALVQQIVSIVHEALTNADKHANAQVIRIVGVNNPDRITITVSDDGCGFDRHAPTTGHGLAIMAERAQLIGGRLHIESAAGAGTTVTLEVMR